MAIESILRRASLVLGTGYVLFFFSERMFWSMWRPGDEMIMHVLAWLLYSFFAYVILAAIRVFHVRDVWGLLLVGALFGWIDEVYYYFIF